MSDFVSVVIPCYNCRDFVGEAIESALAQDGSELEVIVVDDGSTDGTREVLEGYGDRIRRIYQNNGGAGKARNTGIAAAGGEYIAFLDCDDVWAPGKIRRQLEYFRIHPELGLVFTDSEVFNENGTVVPSKKGVRPPAEGWVLTDLFRDNFISTPCVMLRRGCLRKVGGFREDFINAEDYDLWMRIASEYPFGFVDEILVRIRLREGSLNVNFENRFLTDIKIVKQWMQKRPDLFPSDGSEVRERLGRLYFKLGRGLLNDGQPSRARSFLAQSLKENPRISRTWVFLLASLLPGFILDRLRYYLRKRRPGGQEKWTRTVLLAGIFAVGTAGLHSAWAVETTFQCNTILPGPPIQTPNGSRFSKADRARGFVVFYRDKYDPVFPYSIPSEKASGPLSLSAAPNEFEPVMFGLYPLREIGKVRIRAHDLIGENGKAISSDSIRIRIARVQTLPFNTLTIHRSVEKCGPIPFVLMPESEASLRIGEARWIWLTVAVPEGAVQGAYRSQIEIIPEKGSPLLVPFRVSVYPFNLDPSPIQYLMLYETSLLDLPKAGDPVEKDRILRKAEIIYRDMRDHGMTAVSPVETDQFELGPEGRPKFPVTRVSLEIARKVGLRGMPVINIGPLARTEKKKHRWNYTDYDPSIHPDRVKRIVEAVTEWAGAKGWGPVAFSPIDEPTHPERSRIGEEVLKAVKAVEGARTFLACTPGSLSPLARWVDIVDFNRMHYSIKDHRSVKKSGKTVWIYDNGLVFGTDPVRTRFVTGFFAWRAGLDGVTAWTYPLSKHKTVDRMTGWSPPDIGTDGGPVPVTVWEAFREGVDDRRYIETLERNIRLVRDGGKPEAAAAAQKTLNEIAKRMEKAYGWYSGVVKKGPYLGGLKMNELEDARRKIAYEIVLLSQA